MLKNFFLLPGRIFARIFPVNRKRGYRSIRQKQNHGAVLIISSLICWFFFIAICLWGADKIGLMKGALDAGVGVVANEGRDGQSDQDGNTGQNDSEGQTAAVVVNSIDAASANTTTQGIVTLSSNGSVPAGNKGQKSSVEGWVVMLHSIPKSSNGRKEAETRKVRYERQGLEVEIIDSDALPKLKSGNWIIALGPFENKATALNAANAAKRLAPNLMVRRGY